MGFQVQALVGFDRFSNLKVALTFDPTRWISIHITRDSTEDNFFLNHILYACK